METYNGIFHLSHRFRQAINEILTDVKRGAERAKEHGALGWYSILCCIDAANS